MRTCSSCGFENAEEGRSCALCGASAITRVGTGEITRIGSDVPTLALPPGGRPPVSAGAASRLGRVYGKRYRVDALLGRGGMGEVFRARDLEQERDLALKVLRPLDEDDSDRTDRFRREIDILSRIRHPAVPRIHAWGTTGREMFFVSDLVDGHDLKVDIERRGPWPVAEAVALAATVADALAAAHAAGIVHRDVKPSNIMLAADGSVRLLDFGLARGVGIDMTTLTRTGMIVGTPGYMSPEQFEGRGVDERTDVYSLGVVLFELLTARLPFTGSTPIAVAMKHKTEPPPAPRSVRRDVPAWLERVVLRCLEKDPAARFSTATELAAELRKPRRGARPQLRHLPTGDAVVEDEDGVSDWALVLAATEEKVGWTSGLALRFGERYYRLVEIGAPEAPSPRWQYRFDFWPPEEIFRRIVDYEQDCEERRAARERSLSSKLRRWMSKKGE